MRRLSAKALIDHIKGNKLLYGIGTVACFELYNDWQPTTASLCRDRVIFDTKDAQDKCNAKATKLWLEESELDEPNRRERLRSDLASAHEVALSDSEDARIHLFGSIRSIRTNGDVRLDYLKAKYSNYYAKDSNFIDFPDRDRRRVTADKYAKFTRRFIRGHMFRNLHWGTYCQLVLQETGLWIVVAVGANYLVRLYIARNSATPTVQRAVQSKKPSE